MRGTKNKTKKTPSFWVFFFREGKPSVVIFQDERALCLHRDTQCISDMFRTIALLPSALASNRDGCPARGEAEMVHLPGYCGYSYVAPASASPWNEKWAFTSPFLYISISFMETVFHDNTFQMCSLAPFLSSQLCACDLILQTFGRAKRTPSYKTLMVLST